MLKHMKRTTLILDASLYTELKRRAAREGRTLAEVVERALRLGLEPRAPGRQERIELPSYDLGPYLIDPADRSTFGELTGQPGSSAEP